MIKYVIPFIPIIFFIILAFPIITSYNELLFDEVWYVSAAREYLSSRSYERIEHPPLGQLLISSGILLFGDNPIGWRILSLLFGSFSLYLVYFITLKILGNELFAFTTTFLLSTEKMFFTFSTLGVLDIYFIFFSMLSIYTAFNKNIIISALSISAGLCCKLTAILFSPIIFTIILIGSSICCLYWLNIKKNLIKLLKWVFFSFLFLLILLFLFDNMFLNLVNKNILATPIHHLLYMIKTHSSSSWPSGYGDTPWTWIIRPQNYYVNTVSLIKNNFLETFNPLIYGLFLVSLPEFIWKFIKNKGSTSLIILIWVLFTYIIWIPLYFILSRPIFSFYLISTVPVMCISVSAFVNRNKKFQYLFVFFNIIFFILFQYPIYIINF